MRPKLLLGLICVLLVATAAAAQTTVFLVRHAERADTAAGAPATMATDPDLSDVGRQRAASLAIMLKDAHITAIFVTEYKRTQQTAAPLAKALGITLTVVSSRDTPGLVAKLKTLKGSALVVGHSNSVPDVIRGLGVATQVMIPDTEFDHFFIVTTQTAHLIRLRYR
jgi:phosphohistidine phosphatase SixA